MKDLSYRQQRAIRQKHANACMAQMLSLMKLPLGQKAIASGYYTEMSAWVYDELMAGRVPAGVPVQLVEKWEMIGDFRIGKVRNAA